MVPQWMRFTSGTNMATLTIKNFPDDLYADLTQVAKSNRRSINNEAIISVERGLERKGINRELLDRIRKRREEMAKRGIRLTDELLREFKNEGRP
jgi:predicted transcriptional regulator